MTCNAQRLKLVDSRNNRMQWPSLFFLDQVSEEIEEKWLEIVSVELLIHGTGFSVLWSLLSQYSLFPGKEQPRKWSYSLTMMISPQFCQHGLPRNLLQSRLWKSTQKLTMVWLEPGTPTGTATSKLQPEEATRWQQRMEVGSLLGMVRVKHQEESVVSPSDSAGGVLLSSLDCGGKICLPSPIMNPGNIASPGTYSPIGHNIWFRLSWEYFPWAFTWVASVSHLAIAMASRVSDFIRGCLLYISIHAFWIQ